MELLNQVFTPSNLRFMLQGLQMSLLIAVVSIGLSLVIGTLLGAGKAYGPKILRTIISIYIEIFRTTSNLLWILIVYFMVPFPGGISEMTKNFFAGVLAFTLFTSAVIAEIVRGGLNSIPRGQLEAASSQGFSFFQSLRLIILPQAILLIFLFMAAIYFIVNFSLSLLVRKIQKGRRSVVVVLDN